MPDYIKEYFSGLADSLAATLRTPDAYFNKIALSVVILVIGFCLYILLKKIIIRNESDFKSRFRVMKKVKQSVTTITVLLVLFVWVQAINVLILIALLCGVVIVFMVRGLTNNIIGYFVIKYRRYFEVGHRVEINGIIGDVIEINSICFKLLEVRSGLSSDANTGRMIKLPNSIIFNESIEMIGVANTFVWHEIKHILSFDSDWQAAEKIMTEVGETYFRENVEPVLEKQKGHIQEDQLNFQPVFSLNVDEAGIILVLRYLVDYRNGTSAKTEMQR